jgi:hypothetical protein
MSAFSQIKKEYRLFTVTDNSAMSNPELQKVISEAVLLSIDKDELRSLSENRIPEIILNVPFEHNSIVKLNLKRFEILAPNARIVARTETGEKEVHPEDLAVSYTGSAEGLGNNLVTMTFTKDNVSGIIMTEKDNYVFGALNDNDGNRTDNFILYKESDMKIRNSFICGADDNLSTEKIAQMRKAIEEQMNKSSSTDLYVAEIAIEIDYVTYLGFGSSMTNTTNYALTLMALSSSIYMKEVNVRLAIPYMRVWTTTDPYTGTTSSSLLNQFRSEWNTNQQAVQRTLAHFISTRGGGLGGIAYLNVLCSSISGGNGYGFSNTTRTIQPLPTYSWDVMVVSHELGHNFGSNHTMNCGWPGGPIDSCYTVEGGCYTGPPISSVGTIMSYCHLNGSISLVKGFGPLPKAIVRSRAENAGCMYVSERPMQIGYPNGGETFRTGNTTPIYWGTSISAGTVNIEFSLNGGTTWQTVQNNVPASQNQYDWTIPENPSTTQAKLRIVDSSNPAVGDTTDAVFKIILNINAFNLISPPALTRLTVSSSSIQDQDFIWQKGGTDPSINYKFFIKKLGNNPEYGFASNNNGLDSIATIRMSLLDSLAQIMGTTADSVRCTWRVFGYNGIDSTVSSNNFLITLIRSSVGINVISSLIPENFSLGNNYPNPFNPETVIKFDIAKATYAELKLYDSRGSEISTFVNEKLQPGSYDYKFNAGNLPSGVYFYRLKTNEFTETKRMMLIK